MPPCFPARIRAFRPRSSSTKAWAHLRGPRGRQRERTVLLGSIDYAVEHLHVPLIVVLGRGNAARRGRPGKSKPEENLGRLIGEIHVGKHLPANKDKALARRVENNVRQQAKLLAERSDIIRAHVKQHKMHIVVGVYALLPARCDGWKRNSNLRRGTRVEVLVGCGPARV